MQIQSTHKQRRLQCHASKEAQDLHTVCIGKSDHSQRFAALHNEVSRLHLH